MSLRGRAVLVTAGPTREYLDPVRFLTNGSSGKMGYRLAQEARKLGARVTLLSGPVCLPPPRGVRFVGVVTAGEMYREALRRAPGADIVIGAAAVGDFKPARLSPVKIKKKPGRALLRLELKETQDILAAIGRLARRPTVVAFALETDDLLKNARKKLKRKRADMIVANRARTLGSAKTSFTVIVPGEPPVSYRGIDKARAARTILRKAGKVHDARR